MVSANPGNLLRLLAGLYHLYHILDSGYAYQASREGLLGDGLTAGSRIVGGVGEL